MATSVQEYTRVLSHQPDAKRLLTTYIFFSYLGQGLAQHFCLISQPLDNYFLKVYHWNAAQVAAFMAMLLIPWTIKPLFGFASDGLPLFGSTKKIYLELGFALGGVGYLLAINSDRNLLPIYLLLSSAGLACASAVSLGLIVQAYKRKFLPSIFSIQLFAYYLALIGSGILAGWLCNQVTPHEALTATLCVAGGVCFAIALGTPLMVVETKVTSQNPKIFFTLIKQLLSGRKFLLVTAFIFCWSFSPGFGTPLYFHYTSVLHMSQMQIGEANGCHAFGMLSGVLAYSVLRHLTPKLQIQISIWACVLTTLDFTFVSSGNAFVFEFFRGVTSMLGALSINTLAASVSMSGLETLTTAVLMSVYNLGTLSSGVVGASLYTSIFQVNLAPLLFVSAANTACCSYLLRFIEHSRDLAFCAYTE